MTDLVTRMAALEAGLIALAGHLRNGGKEAVEQAIWQVKSPKQRPIQPIDSEVDVYLYTNGKTRVVSYGPRCYTIPNPRARDLDLVPCHERDADVYVVYEYGVAGGARSLVSEVPTKVAARYLAESHFRMLMRERSLKEEIDRLRHLETYRKEVRKAVTGEAGGSVTDEQVLEKIRLLATQPVYAEEQRIGDRHTRRVYVPEHWQMKAACAGRTCVEVPETTPAPEVSGADLRYYHNGACVVSCGPRRHIGSTVLLAPCTDLGNDKADTYVVAEYYPSGQQLAHTVVPDRQEAYALAQRLFRAHVMIDQLQKGTGKSSDHLRDLITHAAGFQPTVTDEQLIQEIRDLADLRKGLWRSVLNVRHTTSCENLLQYVNQLATLCKSLQYKLGITINAAVTDRHVSEAVEKMDGILKMGEFRNKVIHALDVQLQPGVDEIMLSRIKTLNGLRTGVVTMLGLPDSCLTGNDSTTRTIFDALQGLLDFRQSVYKAVHVLPKGDHQLGMQAALEELEAIVTRDNLLADNGPAATNALTLRNELCRQLKLDPEVTNELILSRLSDVRAVRLNTFREAICEAVGVSRASMDHAIIKLVSEMGTALRELRQAKDHATSLRESICTMLGLPKGPGLTNNDIIREVGNLQEKYHELAQAIKQALEGK